MQSRPYYVIIPYDDVELTETRDVPHLGRLPTTAVVLSAGPQGLSNLLCFWTLLLLVSSASFAIGWLSGLWLHHSTPVRL